MSKVAAKVGNLCAKWLRDKVKRALETASASIGPQSAQLELGVFISSSVAGIEPKIMLAEQVDSICCGRTISR
jgi:hypothetical protein